METWIKTSTTSSRLQHIMLQRQIKQADLARLTGISRGAISNYVLGRYEPKSDIISKLAKALNCSEMWLWGYNVPMERTNAIRHDMSVTEGEQMLLDLFRKIPEEKQEMVLQMIKIALSTK